MSRKQSRETVFKLLFSLCFDAGIETSLELATDEHPCEKELQYINKLCTAVRENLAEIDAKISGNAHGFSLDRVYKIDLTVLRIAIGEILFFTDTPHVVAVNEAVNIAKKYGTEKSASYVNGILASVLKEYQENALLINPQQLEETK